jgi:hypothetical protein
MSSHVATIFCNHLAKLLQKDSSIPENQHIASQLRLSFVHLAKLLQKFITSHENQHIASLVANEATKNCAISAPLLYDVSEHT